MATDKIDAFVNDLHTMAKNIKQAQGEYRKRVKSAQALLDSGLLSDDQVTRITEALPKKREPKADA